MKNDLFTIGSITIHGYGLMIGIGIIAAYPDSLRLFPLFLRQQVRHAL